ncbi:MAG: hypothetical protein Q3M30_05965 [Candidatus Electrothrix sp. Rat3]|nr:hypothetical protein [Candidatus Electrothrix rattekaaiensis]
MKKQGRVVRPGCHKEISPVRQQKTFLVENPTRCLVELNRDIGKLHHSFCGDQYDYIIPYYKTALTGTLKAKYTAKIIVKILLVSLLAAGVLILPCIFYTYLKVDLIVPCAAVLILLLYLNLPSVLRLFAKMRGKGEKDRQQGPVQWRILSQKEVEQLKQKITEEFQALFTACARSKENWLRFRERILEVQRKQMLYSAQSMHDIRSTDLLYYRFLSLFLTLYKICLTGVALLLYAYILVYLLITGTHILPVYRLKNIVDCLLFAGVISFFLCLFQLIIRSQFLQNFKQQLAFFHESAQETENRIKALMKRHQV